MLNRLGFRLEHWAGVFARRFRNNFYLFLAALLSVGILLDASVFHVGQNMRQKAFDFIIRHRLVTPPPDPAIVIVDVDEASLAAMSGDFGRWPWPRQVFGEFVEQVQAQKPRAIVFDILFSDADVYNPDSDAYFNEVIAASGNTYFPFLRLPEQYDEKSEVTPGMIPGVREIAPGQGDRQATLAVVLPHFEAALASGRLGTHNITPDPDGIVREYPVWRDEHGWRISSLPWTLAEALGYPAPAAPEVLLNWRGPPFSYQYVSFSDVYRDLTREHRQRPPDEFTDKIVIIGSTAPSLFDIKATAMAKAHPGVEILATAIDNIKHGDYLHFWRGALPYVGLSLLLIWLTAAAFYRNVERDRFNKVFSGAQVGLLTVSYVGINLTDTYLDLTGPVTWAIAYFSIAKIYALTTERALQRWLAYGSGGSGRQQAVLMPLMIDSPEPLGDAALRRLRRDIEASGMLPRSVATLKGTQSGIWGLFGDMLVVSWTVADNEPAHMEQIRLDAEAIATRLPALLSQLGMPAGCGVRYTLHEGSLAGDGSLAAQWRTLFAQAILKLEHKPKEHDT